MKRIIAVLIISFIFANQAKCEIEYDYIQAAYDYFSSRNDSNKASTAIELAESQLKINPTDFLALCYLCKISLNQRIYEHNIDTNDMVLYLNIANMCNDKEPYSYIPYAIWGSHILYLSYNDGSFPNACDVRKEALQYIKMVYYEFSDDLDFSYSVFDDMKYEDQLLMFEYIDIMINVIEYPEKTSAWRENQEGFSIEERETALHNLIDVCYEPDGTYRFPALLKSLYGEMSYIYMFITMTEQTRIEKRLKEADPEKLSSSICKLGEYIQLYDSIETECSDSAGDEILSGDCWVQALWITDEYMNENIRPCYMDIQKLYD